MYAIMTEKKRERERDEKDKRYATSLYNYRRKEC